MIVIQPPLINHKSCFSQTQKQFPVEQFITQFAVERFHVTVLPGAGLLNVQRVHGGKFQPPLNLSGHKLGPVVTANVLGGTTHREQILQHQDHITSGVRTCRLDRQAFSCVFIQHDQQLQLSAIFGTFSHEVVTPHVIAMRRFVTHATVVAATRARQSPAFSLLLRHLHVLQFPDPMDSLVIHLLLQHLFHTRTTKPWTGVSEASHLFDQRMIPARPLRAITLRAAWLTKRSTRATLRDCVMPQTAAHRVHRLPPPFGVYKFGRAASFRINMSNAWSATSFFSRVFSFSNSLSCLAIFGSIPPYF